MAKRTAHTGRTKTTGSKTTTGVFKAGTASRASGSLSFDRAIKSGGGLVIRGAKTARFLGLRPLETTEAIRLNRRGLPSSSLEHLRGNLGLQLRDFSRLVGISERTIARRKEQGRLRPDESDRLLRASRLLARAVDLFEGDAGAARSWLAAPHIALDGAAPLDLASTEEGARVVEDLIGRLEHGVFS